MTPDLRRTLALEVAAADALPPRERVDDDGWRLRFNDGVTRRRNSVFPERSGIDPLDAKVARAETFYRERGAVARFQVTAASRPPQLERALRERGYRSLAGALVQTLELPAADEPFPPEDPYLGTIELGDAPTSTWLDALEAAGPGSEGGAELRAANLRAVAAPRAFGAVRVENEVVAVGLVAVAGAWAGLFNMATLPAWRRRGMGRRLMRALTGYARSQGAELAYLQVHPDNLGARALYASVGFATHHRYDYWEAPG